MLSRVWTAAMAKTEKSFSFYRIKNVGNFTNFQGWRHFLNSLSLSILQTSFAFFRRSPPFFICCYHLVRGQFFFVLNVFLLRSVWLDVFGRELRSSGVFWLLLVNSSPLCAGVCNRYEQLVGLERCWLRSAAMFCASVCPTYRTHPLP